jgi:hypothetical protein
MEEKMNADLTEIVQKRVNWTDLSQDRDKYRDHVERDNKLLGISLVAEKLLPF